MLEAAYDPTATSGERLRNLAKAAAISFVAREPVVACEMSPRSDLAGVQPSDIALQRCDERTVQACLEVNLAMPTAERLLLRKMEPTFMLISELFRGTISMEAASRNGVAEMAVLNCTDGVGGSFMVGALAPSARRWPAEVKAYWSSVAQHLGAASRLLAALRLRPLERTAQAELEVDGTVLRLAPEAAPRHLREALQRAVRQREGVRSRRRSAAERVLWPALVEGRWTLLDAFTPAGSRYVVAYQNPPGAEHLRALRPRERVVLDFVIEGRSGKWVALELGLSEPTITRILQSALRRLGACDLAAIAGVRTALFAPLEGDEGVRSLAVAELESVARYFTCLTQAEMAVAGGILKGQSVLAIANERNTSARTVAHQVASIYRKLGVSSQRELRARIGDPGL
jgi:DNA-binding NarL/FixJ family response regulator